jgi:hypothetical protein
MADLLLFLVYYKGGYPVDQYEYMVDKALYLIQSLLFYSIVLCSGEVIQWTNTNMVDRALYLMQSLLFYSIVFFSGEVIQWTNTNMVDRALYLMQSLLFSPIYALAYLPLVLMKSYQASPP